MKRGGPLRRTGRLRSRRAPRARRPLRRVAPLDRRTPLAVVSARRRRENRKRRRIMHAAYGPNPPCHAAAFIAKAYDYGGDGHRCEQRAVDGHEIQTRARGGSLFDPVNVLPVCRACHDWIHAHPATSTRLGLLKPSWAN